MKHLKLLITAFALFLGQMAWAQGSGASCEDPIPITIDVDGNLFPADNTYGDQWFTFTPDQSGTVEITTCDITNEDTRVEVFSDCGVSQIAYNDDYCGLQTYVQFAVTAGNTYYIVWTQTYTFTYFDWAALLTADGSGTNCSAAIPATEGYNYADNSEGNQWFAFTAPEAGTYEFSSCDLASVDTYLYLYSDCNYIIDASDDYCGLQSSISYTMSAGETVYIEWTNTFTSSSFEWSIFNVESSNTAPYAYDIISDITVSQGFAVISIYLPDYFADADGDNLMYEAYSSYGYNDLIIDGESLYIFEGTSGFDYITVYAVDPYGEYDYLEFTIDVTETNLGETCSDPLPAEVGYNFADNGNGSQWFEFTAPVSDTYIVSSCGLTSNDTWARLYYSCDNSYFESSDDDCSVQTEISFYAEAGETIIIEWYNYYTSGDFEWLLQNSSINSGPEILNYLDYITVDINSEPVVFNLNDYFFDPDGDPLEFYAYSEYGNTYAYTVGDYLYIENFYGFFDYIWIEAYDYESDEYAYQELYVEIIGGNNPPEVLDYIDYVYVEPGFETLVYDLNDYFYDPDGDPLYFSAGNYYGNADVYVDGNYLYITDYSTSYDYIWVEAYDYESGQYAYQEFFFEVYDSNSGPEVWINFDDIYTFSGFDYYSYFLNDYFYDPDGDYLYFYAGSYYGTNDVFVNGDILYIQEMYTGDDIIWVEAYDAESGESAYQEFYFYVEGDMNTPPYLMNPIADMTHYSGFEYTTIDLSDVFYDEEGDYIYYDVYAYGSSVDVSVIGSTLYIYENGTGITEVELSAYDEYGNYSYDYDYFTINIIGELGQGSVCSDPLPAELGMNYADNANGSQWFEFTAPASDYYTLSTCGLTSNDTYARLYYSCDDSYMDASDDDCSLQTEMSFYLNAGETITIEWYDRYTSGTFEWSLQEGASSNVIVIENPLPDMVQYQGFGIEYIYIGNVFSNPNGEPMEIYAYSDYGYNYVYIDGDYLVIEEMTPGTDYIYIEASNGYTSAYDAFYYDVLGDINLAPIVSNPIENIIVDQGFGTYTIDLNTVFTDPDGDMLFFEYYYNGVSYVDLDGSILTINEAASGITNIEVYAYDVVYNFAYDYFSFSVNQAGNTTPIVSEFIGTIEFEEVDMTQTFDLTNYFTDADGDYLSFDILSSSYGIIDAYIMDNSLYVYSMNAGVGTIEITAYDGNGGMASQTVTVNVAVANNEAPIVVGGTDDLDLTSGFGVSTIDLSDWFEDPEGQPLTYSVSEQNGIVDAYIYGTILRIEELGQIGTDVITVTATDPLGATADYYFNVTITENNAPIIIDITNSIELRQGFGEYQINLSDMFNDPDGDEMTFNQSNSNPAIFASIDGDQLIITENGTGTGDLTIIASDGTESTYLTLSVSVLEADNTAPTVINPNPTIILSAIGDTAIALSTIFADDDNDELVYEYVNGDSYDLSIVGDTLYAYFYTIGTFPVRITALDNRGGAVNTQIRFAVSEAGNNIPSVTAVPDVTIDTENSEYRIALADIFSDDEELYYDFIIDNPNVIGASIENDTLIITGRGLGTTSITLFADDSRGGVNSITFDVTYEEYEPTTVEETSIESDINVYPTVASEIITVACSVEQTIEIISTSGSVVAKTIANQTETQIIISDLDAGQYLVKVNDKVKSFIKK